MNQKLDLFDDFLRTDASTSKFKIRAYHFLNNSAIPEAENVRTKIRSWSEGFLITKEFVSKFRSKIDSVHKAALFELYTFHLLKSFGFNVSNIPVSGLKTPDLRAEKAGNKLFIECTSASSSYTDDAEEDNKNLILDSLHKISKGKNLLNVAFITSGKGSPSLKNIRLQIQTMLENGNPSVVIDDSGWKFVVSRSSVSEEDSRGIGVLASPAKCLTPEKNLLQSLKGKLPAKYKLLAPYLIAVNSHDYFLDEISIVDCLFGASAFQHQLHLNKRSEPSFFIQNAEFANSSVSGILLLKKWDIYSTEEPNITLWHHPEPKYKVDPQFFPIDQREWLKTGNGVYTSLEI